jgi:hypothetical protein
MPPPVTTILDVLFTAVHPPRNGDARLVLIDGSDDALWACIEAALGQ